ncbi:MAG: flagellar export chaperone FliS [Proteobacteria bacterium]|nr:flagellar export chaperone FliS [Pseudomonadota bacterium]
MSEYTNQYLATTVHSASPEQLMLMLYDGAIRFLSLGIQAIDNGVIDKRAYYINRASAIVAEFAATLDHKQDAQLAENLDALYAYMLRRMLQANLKNDPAPLLEVKHLLTDLRTTWAQAIELNKQELRDAATIGVLDKPLPTYHPLAVAM